MENDDLKQIIKSKFLTSEKFSLEVEKYVFVNNCNYIEGIVSYCELNEIELESVPKLLSKPLKDKIKNNAIDLNFLKKVTKSKKVI